ncbi:MAG: alanine--tRNA ligase [Candidatus Pacearchaeota archaeon]|jgi:alanyl-tRNA synthetase
MIMRKQLIKKYLDFFKSKNHIIIPSASLIPANDPTVLFTTAGMHPLVPFLLGQKHPHGKRLASLQKCIRTTDIDSVGDTYHHTFFEMLGNWSLGDYWKEDAIKFSYEFLTKSLGIKSSEISVTCFEGNKDAQKDTESEKIWKSLGIKKIKFLGKKDNWWGPAGKTGPCGPDTEMFVNGLEIWNDVFMQYNKDEKGVFYPAKQKNVDTGMGVERTIAVLNGLNDNYLTDAWKPIIEKIEELSGKKYKGNEKAMRIVADHVKASVFLISDGVVPSNTERGYVLRRLIRRAVKYGMINLKLESKLFTGKVAESVFDVYDDYKELVSKKKEILNVLSEEEDKFNKTLNNGLGILRKISAGQKTISAKDAFLLYQSYGFPIEITQEIAKESGLKVDVADFEAELAKHQKLSRTASSGTFKSGLADNSEKTIKLHTATHLLNEALRRVLSEEVRQRGSNITPERLRFDFNFPRKLTDEEIKKVENLVNEKIKQGLPIVREEIKLKEAVKSGAQAEFGTKYPDVVSVYSIDDFSKEICTGPHVKNTREIGKFKIIKEEAIAAGIRRIKAVVE